MKNYIAREGGWATSAGYVKFSFARSIHFGRGKAYSHSFWLFISMGAKSLGTVLRAVMTPIFRAEVALELLIYSGFSQFSGANLPGSLHQRCW